MAVLTSNPPTANGYGLAIYKADGSVLTDFTNDYMLREVYKVTFSSISNASDVSIGTVPSGITSSNSIVVTTYGGASWAYTNTGYITGSDLRINPVKGSGTRSGSATVFQYKDATPWLGSYGLQIWDAAGANSILDSESLVWVVDAQGDLSNTVGTGSYEWARYGSDDYDTDEHASRIVLLLPDATRYPVTDTIAVAVRSSEDQYIIQPYIFANSSGYITKIVFHREGTDEGVLAVGTISYAILVSPEFYLPGAPASDGASYGMEFWNNAGKLTWSSTWKQAVMQELIPFNEFSTGTTGNGSYDHSTGYDGVIAPTLFELGEYNYRSCASKSRSTTVSGLDYDPLKCYVMFFAGQGRVEYNKVALDGSGGSPYGTRVGGGQHWQAVRMKNGGTSVDLKMYRTANGPLGTPTGSRTADSSHPDGHIALVRID